MRLSLRSRLMCHALLALLAVWGCCWLPCRLRDLPALQLEPPLHLLQTEIGRCMYRLEYDTSSWLVLGHRRATETGTLANHPVLQMPNLNDALPVRGLVFRKLHDLSLQ